MDSDRHSKSKRDDRKKDRKKKSRSRSSNSRSRSSSSESSHSRRKKGKKSSYESSDKYSSKHKESRDEMPIEDDFRKNMGYHAGYPGYPGYQMMGYDRMMGGPMMTMPMQRPYPSFPMQGYNPMMRPHVHPPGAPGMIPPLPNQMDPMMSKMGRVAMKPFVDPKAIAPASKKEKEKSIKKEEESGKVLEFPPNIVTAETFRSLHLSVKNLQEPLFLFTCKKILSDLESKLRDKKLKSRAKEISEFLSNLYDKIKDAEKKDKKKGGTSTSEVPKISELELANALNAVEDIKIFLGLVNLEKFSLESCFESDTIHVVESDESVSLFEDAQALFESSRNVTV